jgi:hypothetical protein
MKKPITFPRLFALAREGEESDQVVGYGMVLPEGSAHSVSWPAPGYYHSASSAEQTALLRNAKLHWI